MKFDEKVAKNGQKQKIKNFTKALDKKRPHTEKRREVGWGKGEKRALGEFQIVEGGEGKMRVGCAFGDGVDVEIAKVFGLGHREMAQAEQF